MKRKVLIVLLSIGMVGGFVSGVRSVKKRVAHHKHERMEQWAEQCSAAAIRTYEAKSAGVDVEATPKREKHGCKHERRGRH